MMSDEGSKKSVEESVILECELPRRRRKSGAR